MNNSLNKTRIAYIDNLKSLMIIFVVIIHVACTYSGIGRWYYTEHNPIGKTSFYFFLFFMTFTQAYFMSLLFMIAGYFIPSSLDRKGAKKFIADRLFRLGIPTLIYIFLIFTLIYVLLKKWFDKLASLLLPLKIYYS